MSRAIALAVIVTLGGARTTSAAVQGEGAEKTLLAVRTAAAPAIDGDLGDEAWGQAPPDDRFTQQFPDDGKAPTQRTEVRVIYDDQAIYVGVRMFDTDPDAIVARLTRRDRQIEGDYVMVGFDSNHAHNVAYVFQLNAAGVQSDALISNDTSWSYDWDAVWEGATRRDAGGWSAEFRIPLSVLRFGDAQRQIWGFQVRRYLSRRQEQSMWTHVPRTASATVSRWGHLDGLSGLKPRRTIELRPFAVSYLRTHTDAGGAFLGLQSGNRTSADAEIGLDAKIGITSDLTFDATINPDFGQVEADQVVLNLSRFETFFPEKRPFFLEGMDAFATPVNMFYSRRIGRPPSGLAIGSSAATRGGEVYPVVDAPSALPIYAAAKLTGQAAGALTIGALTAVTAPEEVVVVQDAAGTERDLELAPARSWSVLRLRYALGGNSYVGLIGTSVLRLGDDLLRASANHDAFSEGVDGQWQSADAVWRLRGQVLATHREGGTAFYDELERPCDAPAADRRCWPITRSDGTRMRPGDAGWGADVRGFRRGEHWIGELGWNSYAPRLDPNDLGFLTRFNEHRLSGWTGYQDSRTGATSRYWFAGGGGDLATTFDGVVTVAEAGGNFEMELAGGHYFNVNLGFAMPSTWDIHETGDGARVERAGGVGGGVYLQTDARKKVQLKGGVWGAKTFLDDSWDVFTEWTASFKVIPTLELDLAPQLSWVSDALRVYFDDPCLDERGEVCDVDSMLRSYRFGELDSGHISLTLRATYTFSPTLTVQGYAQLFMAQGDFGDMYTLQATGAHPELRRDDLVADPDFDPPGDGFQDLSLNVNLVLRWELAPGSTLLAVYTRSQQAAYDLSMRAPRFQLSGLDTGPAEDIVLLKLTYFVL